MTLREGEKKLQVPNFSTQFIILNLIAASFSLVAHAATLSSIASMVGYVNGIGIHSSKFLLHYHKEKIVLSS